MSNDFLDRYLSFEVPAYGEPWVDGEPPRRRFLCWIGLHLSICHNYVCGHSFDTCNYCMRRV